jgi:nucleolar protein 9
MEISNLFDNKEIDLDERSTICANALEETRGKELELATDAVISHTLQLLMHLPPQLHRVLSGNCHG